MSGAFQPLVILPGTKHSLTVASTFKRMEVTAFIATINNVLHPYSSDAWFGHNAHEVVTLVDCHHKQAATCLSSSTTLPSIPAASVFGASMLSTTSSAMAGLPTTALVSSPALCQVEPLPSSSPGSSATVTPSVNEDAAADPNLNYEDPVQPVSADSQCEHSPKEDESLGHPGLWFNAPGPGFELLMGGMGHLAGLEAVTTVAFWHSKLLCTEGLVLAMDCHKQFCLCLCHPGLLLPALPMAKLESEEPSLAKGSFHGKGKDQAKPMDEDANGPPAASSSDTEVTGSWCGIDT
ncbi:hypothetical protein V8E53_011813 [Lactarius tabidus]